MKPKCELFLGDITDLEVDAIVNAANDYLVMGSGVAGAIKKKGGKIIEKEAVRQAPIPIGEAVYTTAGNLKAKYVIHAAGMGRDLRTNASYIKNSTLNSLKRAEELKLKSVAFPAIGTGVGGFPIEECAQVMISTVKDYLPQTKSIQKVIFALFDKQGYEAFEDQMKRITQ